ncbi:hypothetical protein BGZ76_002132 [Entomortierella beljakovae]|nr:hypothetical protein BGZ76_002132 [Entomortierella beljakovae]
MSTATRIFLDEGSIKAALEPAVEKNACTVDSEDRLTSLRQLRTNFHDSSTYVLCRASGPFTECRAAQPYTVFTVATCDKFRSGGKAMAIAVIFNEIAKVVLSKGCKGRLQRRFVEDANVLYGVAKDEVNEVKVNQKNQVKVNQKTKVALEKVIDLFERNENSKEHLTIIANNELNTQLEVLASSLSTSIEEIKIPMQNYVSAIVSDVDIKGSKLKIV